jgi:hypothetical protein
LTKLVNENINDWDEQLSIVLFSYQTSCKVGISPTPFQLVYGLHPLLLIEYMLPSKLGDNRDPQHVRETIGKQVDYAKSSCF